MTGAKDPRACALAQAVISNELLEEMAAYLRRGRRFAAAGTDNLQAL